MKLNKNRYEAMTTGNNPNLHFQDGTRLRIMDSVTYLGCELNMDGNTRVELGKRISKAMAILKS